MSYRYDATFTNEIGRAVTGSNSMPPISELASQMSQSVSENYHKELVYNGGRYV